MQAKSIKGRSAEEVQSALLHSMTDGFRANLAIVFISIKQDRKTVCEILTKQGIDVIGATSSGEFIDGYQSEGEAAILLLDLNKNEYCILFEDIGERTVENAAEHMATIGFSVKSTLGNANCKDWKGRCFSGWASITGAIRRIENAWKKNKRNRSDNCHFIGFICYRDECVSICLTQAPEIKNDNEPQKMSATLKQKLFYLLSGCVLIFGCAEKRPIDKRSRLAGMYKLYIAENADSNGVWHEDPWTKGGTGYIIYDGIGHMAVHITRKGYNDYKWLPEEESLRDEKINQKLDSMSSEELKEAVRAFASSYVYAGNYTIEDTADVVKHERISTSIHSALGSTVRRAFTFIGDTIILRVLNGNRRLKWIRQP